MLNKKYSIIRLTDRIYELWSVVTSTYQVNNIGRTKCSHPGWCCWGSHSNVPNKNQLQMRILKRSLLFYYAYNVWKMLLLFVCFHIPSVKFHVRVLYSGWLTMHTTFVRCCCCCCCFCLLVFSWCFIIPYSSIRSQCCLLRQGVTFQTTPIWVWSLALVKKNWMLIWLTARNIIYKRPNNYKNGQTKNLRNVLFSFSTSTLLVF